MTIVAIILQCTMAFEFYAPALIIDQFNWSIYGTGVVMGISELIAYPVCYWMITRIGRRVVAYWCFGIALVCSIILFFIWKQG